jgi:hypothetical protein
MTPAQFKAALKKLGATPSSKKAAEMLGVTVRQNQRFMSGENEVPPTIQKLLACLLREKRPKG